MPLLSVPVLSPSKMYDSMVASLGCVSVSMSVPQYQAEPLNFITLPVPHELPAIFANVSVASAMSAAAMVPSVISLLSMEVPSDEEMTLLPSMAMPVPAL